MFFIPLLLTLESDTKSDIEKIFDSYGKYIYQTALSILHDHHDAEEVLGEVLVNVIENSEKFVENDGNKIAPQIVIYTRNAAINRYRKNKRKAGAEFHYTYVDENGDEAQIEMPDAAADVEEIVAGRERAELIRRYLMQLPAECRDAITLVYSMGYSNKEAAKILHITPNAVALRLRRAKNKLKEMMGGDPRENN